MSAARERGLAAGEADFDKLLAKTRLRFGAESIQSADLLTSFGIQLYIEDPDAGGQFYEASRKYLKEAVPAYEAAFGPDHPEVAVALNTYADVERHRSPNNPSALVISLHEEALRMRLKSLGPKNAETRASFTQLGDLYALPERLKQDQGSFAKADAYYREAIASAPNGPEGDETANKAAIELKFAKLHARYGSPAVATAAARNAMALSKDWPPSRACRLVDSVLPDVARPLAARGHRGQAAALKRVGQSACDRMWQVTPFQRILGFLLGPR
jgi:tetratricopeptide (TPR) repeat protein